MTGKSRRPAVWIVAAVTGLAAASILTDKMNVPGQVAAYFTLTFVPGFAMLLFFERRIRLLDGVLAGLALSPVLVSIAAALLMLSGRSPATTGQALVLVAMVLGIAAAARSSWIRLDASLTPRRLLPFETVGFPAIPIC